LLSLDIIVFLIGKTSFFYKALGLRKSLLF